MSDFTADVSATVSREALADVLAESRWTGLGGMTERQACLHMANAIMAWFTSRAALAVRPAPTVNAADVKRSLEALLRFPATFEGTQWVSAAVLRGLIDSAAWVTAPTVNVADIAAIIDPEAVTLPDANPVPNWWLFDMRDRRRAATDKAVAIIAALGFTVADEGRAEA